MIFFRETRGCTHYNVEVDAAEVDSYRPKPETGAVGERAIDFEPMLYCPVCSLRLAERKCKLFCERCGYYMSCADYY
jgi:hypothetical protein